MKTKVLNLKMIFILLGVMFSLPSWAGVSYGDTLEVTSQGQVLDAIDFLLHEGAGSPEVITRVRVKNGVEFYVQLPMGHAVSHLDGGAQEGNRIKVSKAGTLWFRFSYNGKRYLVMSHVNYYGVLQYDGKDAPKEISVTKENELTEVYFPEGKFAGIRWFNGDGQSLADIIPDKTEKISLKKLKETGFTQFKVRTRDGTSNELGHSGMGGGESWNEFKIILHHTYSISLSAQPADGGSVQGTGTFNENSQVTVTATANNGYKFVKWTEDGVEVSTSASYQFKITKNRNLVAVFEPVQVQTYTVSLSAEPAEGGSVSGEGKFDENSQVTVSASPNKGWRFVKWTENGAQVSTSTSYQFQITSNRNLVAHFEPIPLTQYTVSLSAEPAEGGSVSGEGKFDENSQVTVTATPKEGYKFVKWTENGAQVSTSASYQFQITKDRNLVAVFEAIPPQTYSVSLSAQPAEGGSVSGEGKFDENSQVTVTATANNGYKFVKWTEDGVEVSTSASYQFKITKNRNLVAVFEPVQVQTYTVSLSAQPADGGSVQGTGTFNENSQVTVTATANNGYKFVKWTEDGVEVSTSASYQFKITSNRKLVAVFEPIPPVEYSITVAQLTNGAITPSVNKATKGTEVSLEIKPVQNYRLREGSLKVIAQSGVNVAVSNNRFKMPAENVTISAEFEVDTAIEEVSSHPAVKIFPNPATEKLEISNAAPSTKVELYNLQGEVLISAFTDAYGEAGLDISSFPSGIYIVRVGKMSSKFIKNL